MCMIDLFDRDDRMLRSYNELITRVPLIKILTESGDAESLDSLYRNVSVSG
jgi:hypothetical protein